MRGELIGVWSETQREMWQPPIDELLFGGTAIHADPIPAVAVLAGGLAGASVPLSKSRGFVGRLAFWRRGR